MTNMATLRAAMQEQGRFVPSSLPAPVLGWNARDALDGMQPGFAVILDNWFPYNGFCTLRGGSRNWTTTPLGGPVETLACWSDAGQMKVIAGANGQLWEVSFGSQASLASGFTSDRWQCETTKGSRAQGTVYTYLVNGADTPQAYNGTTVAPVTWAAASGQPALTITNLHNVLVSQDVLFLAEKGQLGFWHGPKGDVGPATELSWFDLGTVLPGGGEIVDMATMTMEGGEGPDDYTLFMSSDGWLAQYSGGDPSQATDWAIIGRFPLGAALGKRCMLEIAGDVIVMTVNGYISVRQFIQMGGLLRQSFAFNDNIQPEVVRQTLDRATTFGWQPILVPDLTLALFNVPTSPTTSVQHVVNTQTAAWAQIKGWDGLCWLAAPGALLFGTAEGHVVQGNFGPTDVGNVPIVANGLTAFNDFGSRGLLKQWQMARAILETVGSVEVRVGIAVDYDPAVNLVPVTAPPVVPEASEWDVGEWDTAVWAGTPQTLNVWQSVTALGYAGALYLNVVSTGDLCRWKSTALSHTMGGLI